MKYDRQKKKNVNFTNFDFLWDRAHFLLNS